ncbi:hypothetical protein MKX01_021235 [Papaver californicum]|nr:hypothetical protein MKX01_021235 [Papaver californicum]
MEELIQNETKFSLRVDKDSKANEFRLFSTAPPHMRAFHLAWIASFCGSIFSRLLMGPACDLFGPRLASSALSILNAPIFIANSLASSQFWMSSMFFSNIVGLANGFAAGWANVGCGSTQLLMPLIYSYITSLGVTSFTAWRMAFILPVAQDTSPKDSFLRIMCTGLKNYRGWILAPTYGFCFRVELMVDNIIAQYFYDRFNLKIQTAGAIAASFGLDNLLSLGVIAGMTGSGGTIGEVVNQLLLFSDFTTFSKETGISVMGLMIMICTLPVIFLHFPQWGGMFCGPSMDSSSINSHDYYLLA